MKKRHSIRILLAAAALLLATAPQPRCSLPRLPARRTNWRTATVCPKDNTRWR